MRLILKGVSWHDFRVIVTPPGAEGDGNGEVDVEVEVDPEVEVDVEVEVDDDDCGDTDGARAMGQNTFACVCTSRNSFVL